MMLPQIEDKVIERPGSYGTKKTQYVPHSDYVEFWTHLYNTLSKSEKFQFPLKEFDQKTLNPYFGFFGDRYNPIRNAPHYFHVGLDFRAERKSPVFPVTGGILEYSGFSVINGNYVLLSHPEFTTEDGYMLFSLYMHMRTRNVNFSSYQKMLREISLHSYPMVPIEKKTQIGTMGNSGNIERYSAHLHLQLEFRNNKGKIIAIDPLGILGQPLQKNISAIFNSQEDFFEYYETNKESIDRMDMSEYWLNAPSSEE